MAGGALRETYLDADNGDPARLYPNRYFMYKRNKGFAGEREPVARPSVPMSRHYHAKQSTHESPLYTIIVEAKDRERENKLSDCTAHRFTARECMRPANGAPCHKASHIHAGRRGHFTGARPNDSQPLLLSFAIVTSCITRTTGTMPRVKTARLEA